MNDKLLAPWELNYYEPRQVLDRNCEEVAYVHEVLHARLIAAAPDLLEACERVLAWAQTPDSEPDGSFLHFAEDIVPRLSEIVAEAKGE